MNVHNKTRLTRTRINCELKESSCKTPLLKILKITILASNESSISNKVIKYSHTKNDSIFTHNSSRYKVLESNVILTLTKVNTNA